MAARQAIGQPGKSFPQPLYRTPVKTVFLFNTFTLPFSDPII
jgi:hypothetical protein